MSFTIVGFALCGVLADGDGNGVSGGVALPK
jgi:hypothetical protein